MAGDCMSVGTYFREEDYASAWRRLLAVLVDIPVLLVLTVAVWTALYPLLSEIAADAAFLPITVLLSFVYLVILKRSRLRTLGYRLADVRIVDLRGGVPSIGAMTLRLIFAVFGPLNGLFDLVWIPGDPRRQALRDKFAHTYVVRADAESVGTAAIEYRHYFALGWTFLFREVGHVAHLPPPAPA